jgi:hypothetical protein
MDFLKSITPDFSGLTAPAAAACIPAGTGANAPTNGIPKAAPTLTIAVTGFSDEPGYTVYTVQTVYGSQQFEASQRFSAFEKLHEQLSEKLPGEKIPFPLSKKLIVTDALKKERVVGLEDYLQGLMKMVSMSGAPPPAELLEFLGA